MSVEKKDSVKVNRARRSIDSILFSIWPFVGITMVFTVIGSLGLYNWVPDLSTNFFLQYFLVQALFFAILLSTRKWKGALLVLPFLILSILKIVPIYIDKNSDVESVNQGTVVKLLQANLLAGNKSHTAILNYVEKLSPDILLFEEVTQPMFDKLSSGLAQEYKQIEAVTRPDSFGIAVFSKLSKVKSSIVPLGYSAVPSVDYTFEIDGKTITLYGVHVYPPISGSGFRERNLQYDEIALYRKKASKRFVLAGDLNSTFWSPFFRDLNKKTGLSDSCQGKGLQPTWPVQFPFLYIGIDHCLHSEHFKTLKREVGPDIGSDHKPVYVELLLKE